jgi:hypothetical protein
MQGLNIRIARRLNRVMRRSGRVFADHYHSRLLRSPTELVNAVAYVLGNHAHHFGGAARRDPFSSAALAGQRRERTLSLPRTWLLRSGWKRAQRRARWGSQSKTRKESEASANEVEPVETEQL